MGSEDVRTRWCIQLGIERMLPAVGRKAAQCYCELTSTGEGTKGLEGDRYCAHLQEEEKMTH